jgi:hypothetical protein
MSSFAGAAIVFSGIAAESLPDIEQRMTPAMIGRPVIGCISGLLLL